MSIFGEELGIRHGRIYGMANVQLTPEAMAELGAALGTLLGERSLVMTARDYYPPSRMLKRAFSSGLMSTGITVMDFHGATLPELAFAIKRFGAKAGIQFTVSPYREDSIEIKILDRTCCEFSQDRLNELLRLYRTKHIVRTIPRRIGWVSYAEYIHDIYVAAVVGTLDIPPIVEYKPKIVVDSNFGPVSAILPDFLSEIGVDSITLNSHKPPIHRGVRHVPPPESLRTLSRIVSASGSSLGVAFCADACSLLLVDDGGRILKPDETIALLLMFFPENARVVVTDTVSTIVDKVAEERNIQVTRVKGAIGDISRYVRRTRAFLGATDKGEYIFTSFSLSPDSIFTLGKVLEQLSVNEVTLSEMAKKLPDVRTYSVELDVEQKLIPRVLDAILGEFKQAINTMSSLKVIEEDYWFHVEPLLDRKKIKVSVEDPSKDKVDLMKKSVVSVVERIVEDVREENV